MKAKSRCVFLLLSIFGIYYLCPLLCPMRQAADGAILASHPTERQSKGHTSGCHGEPSGLRANTTQAVLHTETGSHAHLPHENRTDSQPSPAPSPSHSEHQGGHPTCCDNRHHAPTQDNTDAQDNGNCCFDRITSLGTSELRPISQTSAQSLEVVFLIPVIPNTPFVSNSFAIPPQFAHIVYKDPPATQNSSRAPPFSLT